MGVPIWSPDSEHPAMVCLKSVSTHLSREDAKIIPDVIFCLPDGEVGMHKIALFLGFPLLADMLCKACVDTHENIIIVVPDGTSGILQRAVDEFYDGNGERLADIFGMAQVEDI